MDLGGHLLSELSSSGDEVSPARGIRSDHNPARAVIADTLQDLRDVLHIISSSLHLPYRFENKLFGVVEDVSKAIFDSESAQAGHRKPSRTCLDALRIEERKQNAGLSVRRHLEQAIASQEQELSRACETHAQETNRLHALEDEEIDLRDIRARLLELERASEQTTVRMEQPVMEAAIALERAENAMVAATNTMRGRKVQLATARGRLRVTTKQLEALKQRQLEAQQEVDDLEEELATVTEELHRSGADT